MNTIEDILSLFIQSPTACTKAMQDLLRQTRGVNAFAAFTRSIGVDYARTLFVDIEGPKWAEILKASRADEDNDLRWLHRQLTLAENRTEAFDSGSYREANPFQLFRNVSNDDKARLLAEFKTEELALFSVFLNFDEMQEISHFLSRSDQCQFILAIKRLERIPNEGRIKAAHHFARQLGDYLIALERPLQTLATSPVNTIASPPTVAIEQLTQAKEKLEAEQGSVIQIMEYLKQANPSLYNRIHTQEENTQLLPTNQDTGVLGLKE